MKWGKLQDQLLGVLPKSSNDKDMAEELILVMKNDRGIYYKWHRHFCRLRDGEGVAYGPVTFTNKLVCRWNSGSFNDEQRRGGDNKYVCEYTYYRMMEELYEVVWGLEEMRTTTNPCAEIYLEQTKQTNEETNMITIENKTFINNKDVNDYSDDQLIALIVKLEGQQSDLQSIKAGSSHIAQKIVDIKNTIKDVTALLDSRV